MTALSVDILIPTLKEPIELEKQIAAIRANTRSRHRIIASCKPVSAAENRNFCLDWARGQVAIMIDDDIEGFFPGWETALMQPLLDDIRLYAVSARLMNPDGSVGPTCMDNDCLSPDLIYLLKRRECIMPTAAIALRNDGIRFDARYEGSGWEDNDFFFEAAKRRPGARFAVTNACRLVHRNEMKNQYDAGRWERNMTYFRNKWGIR